MESLINHFYLKKEKKKRSVMNAKIKFDLIYFSSYIWLKVSGSAHCKFL